VTYSITPVSRRFLFALLCSLAMPPSSWCDETGNLKVGLQADGRIVVPTNQVLKPAGKQLTFPGRPVDLLLIDGGHTLVVKNRSDLLFVDVATASIKQTLRSPAGFSVVGLVAQGQRIYASDAMDHVRVAERQEDGTYRWGRPLALIKPKVGGAAHPAGMALSGGDLWVTSTRGNNVQRIDLTTGKVVEAVPVGVAPFTIHFPRPDRAYVSNWGGDPPAKDQPQSLTSKTPVRIDPRTGVANHGSVSVLASEDGKWRQIKTISVGLHPCAITGSKNGKLVYVANACSDTVSVIDTEKEMVVETIPCRPEKRLPFGSGANALALSPDGAMLYVANGSNNCIAVIRLGAKSAEPRRAGCMITEI
jgi:YVTN family beta-propeller protein